MKEKLEDLVDWQYRREFKVTKIDESTGLPSECVVYEHRDVKDDKTERNTR